MTTRKEKIMRIKGAAELMIAERKKEEKTDSFPKDYSVEGQMDIYDYIDYMEERKDGSRLQ